MLFLMLLLAEVAWCAETPQWVSRPPAPDGVYHYYVGRAMEEKNLSTAWRAATQDAYETAIKENFGVATSIQATDYQSLERSQLEKRVDEKSQRVRLEKFEQKDNFVQKNGDKVDLYLLFRYPDTEIAKERERLATAVELPSSELTEVGSNQSSSATRVRIESEPPGADVYIDDNRWGVTPLVIKGVMPVGVYEVALRHPRYQDTSEKMILVAGREKIIRKILQPAQSWLRVEPTPSNAKVIIDGSNLGEGETESRLVPAGQDLRVQVEHPDCETMIRVVRLEKNEARTVRISLPMKPDRTPKAPPEERQRPFWPEAEWYQSTWIFGVGFELSESNAPYPYAQSYIGFNFSVERRFFYRLGLRAKASYDMALEGPSQTSSNNTSYSSSSDEEGISGPSFGVGIPIYLSGDDSSFYLMPEWGRISRKIPETYLMKEAGGAQNSKTEKNFIYERTGITLGYQSLSGHYDVWVSHYSYDWREKGKHNSTLMGIAFKWGNP